MADDRFWVANRATLLWKHNKCTIGFASVVSYRMFLYERIDKSKLDKSALFTFDSIPFFGCLILDFLIFFLVYETPYY